MKFYHKNIWVAFFILAIFLSCNNEKPNPREMNGKTYLYTADSVYFITFKIDSVEAREYEHQDRN